MSDNVPDRKAQITFGKFQNVDMRVGRIVSAEVASGTNAPCRIIQIDLGPLGTLQSVGQFAQVADADLVGKNIVVCINLGTREMGPHVSEALVMGAPHPESPADQHQATPLYVDERVAPGSVIF